MYAHIPLMLKTLEKKKGREMLAEARGKIVALVNVITIANIMGRKTIDNKYSTCQNTQQGFKQIISTLLYRDLYVMYSVRILKSPFRDPYLDNSVMFWTYIDLKSLPFKISQNGKKQPLQIVKITI